MASPTPEVLTLQQLVEQHSRSLPISVNVVQGYYGRHSQLALHNEDTYTMHLVKHTQVVTLKDTRGIGYSVPFNSAFKFGLIYTTTESQQSPETGMEFEKCSDILEMPVLPKVVYVIRGFQGKHKKSTVVENEILVVQPHKSHRNKGLSVFSLLSSFEKVLPAECTACFSTKPSLTCMHLPQIAKHVPNVFPCQTMMFKDHSSGSESPKIHSSLLSNPVSLVESREEVSLIASSTKQSSSLKDSIPTLLDIPVDDIFSEVEVTVVQTPHSKGVYRNLTKQIIDTFDPTKVVYFKDTESSRSYKTQSTFYTAIRSGHERAYITLQSSFGVKVMPTPKEQSSLSHLTLVADEGEGSGNEVAIYEEMDKYDFPESTSDTNEQTPLINATARSKQRPVPPPKPQHKSHAASTVSQPNVRVEMSQYETMDYPINTHLANDNQQTHTSQKHVSSPPSTSVTLEERITNLEAQSKKQLEAHEKQKAKLNHLAMQVKSLEDTAHSATKGTENAVEPDSTGERNRSYLRSLNAVQVQQMLEAMNLQQYKEAFRAECIDGEILHDLDEQVLKVDLGVTSKLHVLRLMKIISGARSVEDFC